MPFLEMPHISYLHSYIQRKDMCVCVCVFEVFEVIYFDFL